MSVIQLGSTAGAIVACMTLVTKLFDLIKAIQLLIGKIDSIFDDLKLVKRDVHEMQLLLQKHEVRILSMEEDLFDAWH